MSSAIGASLPGSSRSSYRTYALPPEKELKFRLGSVCTADCQQFIAAVAKQYAGEKVGPLGLVNILTDEAKRHNVTISLVETIRALVIGDDRFRKSAIKKCNDPEAVREEHLRKAAAPDFYKRGYGLAINWKEVFTFPPLLKIVKRLDKVNEFECDTSGLHETFNPVFFDYAEKKVDAEGFVRAFIWAQRNYIRSLPASKREKVLPQMPTLKRHMGAFVDDSFRPAMERAYHAVAKREDAILAAMGPDGFDIPLACEIAASDSLTPPPEKLFQFPSSSEIERRLFTVEAYNSLNTLFYPSIMKHAGEEKNPRGFVNALIMARADSIQSLPADERKGQLWRLLDKYIAALVDDVAFRNEALRYLADACKPSVLSSRKIVVLSSEVQSEAVSQESAPEVSV